LAPRRRAASTVIAERIDTACSPEAPPNTRPTTVEDGALLIGPAMRTQGPNGISAAAWGQGNRPSMEEEGSADAIAD
jgi:hypothetical protein